MSASGLIGSSAIQVCRRLRRTGGERSKAPANVVVTCFADPWDAEIYECPALAPEPAEALHETIFLHATFRIQGLIRLLFSVEGCESWTPVRAFAPMIAVQALLVREREFFPRTVSDVSGSCHLRSASRRAAHAQVPMVIANIGTIRHQSEAGFSDPGLCQICQVRVNIASRPDRDFGLAVGNAEVREKLDAPQGFEP
jgi:hypothetical protein